jgi:hypothetical protein
MLNWVSGGSICFDVARDDWQRAMVRFYRVKASIKPPSGSFGRRSSPPMRPNNG